ncbi:hypothetical protein D3C78_1613120 [compost metagenome]
MDQRHGHHVAIGNVADFVGDHRFRLITAHVLQQAGTDRHQRCIAACAGRKGVDVRCLVDGHLRHGDTRLLRLAAHRVQQPALGFVTRLFNHFPTDGAQRHPFGHQQ